MKRSVFRFVLSSLLVIAPFLTASAGVSVMTDEDLGAVSAKGFETVMPGISGEYNNFNSVQLGGTAQSGSSAMTVYNVIMDSVNIHQNVVDLEGVTHFNSYSNTIESATNNALPLYVSQTNYASVGNQSNNVGSVILDGRAQSGASAFQILNSGYAAGDISQQIARVGKMSSDVDLRQHNSQDGTFAGSATQKVTNKMWVMSQGNNNASVDLGGSAQSKISVMALGNTAASTLNIGQTLASLSQVDGVYVHQVNCQEASSDASAVQYIKNYGAVIGQGSNNGSVVAVGTAQKGASGLAIADAALSAVNIGQNFIASTAHDLKASQKNIQDAANFAATEQTVKNKKDVAGQSNFSTAVAIGDMAQSYSKTDALTNTANSAVNVGQNILSADMSGRYMLTGKFNYSQKNYQTANNGVLDDPIITGNTQKVTNSGMVISQANSNASVMAADDAQKGASSAALVNAALSAVNVGQNIASITGNGSKAYIDITQKNVQTADNSGDVYQKVENKKGVTGQINNAGSVQVYDGAQDYAHAIALTNAAQSAVNVGQNIASVKKGPFDVTQSNRQTAFSEADASQYVKNYGKTSNQFNNDGSVQIWDAQNVVSAYSLVNAAASAVNVGQNMADVTTMGDTDVKQTNKQSAQINATQITYGQSVENKGKTDHQNNNAESVQLAGAQNAATGLSILNAAETQANIGQNVASIGATKEASVTQKNMQTDQIVAVAGVVPGERRPGDSSYSNSNYDSVWLSGSQGNASGMSIANLAAAAANVGQNVIDVTALSTSFLQTNLQKTGVDNIAVQYVDNMKATGQTNNNGSVYMDSSMNKASGVSILDAALSSVNVGQNIASVIAGVAEFSQVNLQSASAEAMGVQYVSGYGVTEQANNNGSVQLLGGGSQNYAEADSLANIAGSAANIGQNVASVGALGAAFAQLNGQIALGMEGFSQTVVSGKVTQQVNDNASVRLDDSQNHVKALSLANIASSAANVGQNIASVEVAATAAFLQLNLQLAAAYDGSAQTVESDAVTKQANNNGSVQLLGGGSQNYAHAMSLANIAGSAANIGQNVASVEGVGRISPTLVAFAQGNVQVALEAAPVNQTVMSDGVMQQANNNGSVQAVDSQNDGKAISMANMAATAGNIGQNIASVGAANVYFAQANLQVAGLDTAVTQEVGSKGVMKQASNNASIQLIDSQSVTSALSMLNAAGSAANVGQNIADVTGHERGLRPGERAGGRRPGHLHPVGHERRHEEGSGEQRLHTDGRLAGLRGCGGYHEPGGVGGQHRPEHSHGPGGEQYKRAAGEPASSSSRRLCGPAGEVRKDDVPDCQQRLHRPYQLAERVIGTVRSERSHVGRQRGPEHHRGLRQRRRHPSGQRPVRLCKEQSGPVEQLYGIVGRAEQQLFDRPGRLAVEYVRHDHPERCRVGGQRRAEHRSHIQREGRSDLPDELPEGVVGV